MKVPEIASSFKTSVCLCRTLRNPEEMHYETIQTLMGERGTIVFVHLSFSLFVCLRRTLRYLKEMHYATFQTLMCERGTIEFVYLLKHPSVCVEHPGISKKYIMKPFKL
jgi:hypothetical protein